MKARRILSAIAALCMAISMLSMMVLPAAAEGDAIIITTADQLANLAFGDLSADYELGADIDMAGKSFTPIGTKNIPFTGTFDGKYYKISNLVVEGDGECVGLFGVNGGTVRNVTLDDSCSFSGSQFVGAVAGRNNGIIEDCIIDAEVIHSPKAESQEKTYTLLSQNLCQWGDNDLAASSNYVDSTTNSRRPSMLQRILNANPDLLCFQEVSFSDYTKHGKKITAWDTYLRNQLTDYTIYGTYRSNSDKEGVTVGWKTNQFEKIDQGMFWLSERPDAPRDQQGVAWDASNVRACTWVLLEHKQTGDHLAIYCTHYDHKGNKAMLEGAKVVTSKMADKKAELLAQYPDAMFIMTGDLNLESTHPGYEATDAGFGGWLDDARNLCDKGAAITDLTYGDNINSVTDSDGIIDYIFADASTIEVDEFKILTDYYGGFRPSDHHGVYAEFQKAQNNAVGGICGSNGGEIRRVIACGSASGEEESESLGNLIGANMGKTSHIYTKNLTNAIGTGKMDEIHLLPEEVSVNLIASMNKEAGEKRWSVYEGKYILLGGRDLPTPVCLTVNGEDIAAYPGEIFTAEDFGIEDPTYFFNGEILEGNSFIVPEEGGVLNVADSVSSVENELSFGEYTIKSMADLIYLYNNLDYFSSQKVTIHLLTDLDFSTAEAARFAYFLNPGFAFHGHDHAIKNWGSESFPKHYQAFFVVSEAGGAMPFIKNIRFENCHIKNTNESHSAMVYAINHGNAGMEGLLPELTLKDIKVVECSLNTNYEASAFILNRYGSVGQFVNVYLQGCEVRDSVLDANGKDHVGFLLGKIRSNGSLMQAKFFMEDCIVEGNELKNAGGSSGFAFGTIEVTSIDAYLHNVAIMNNTSSGGDKFGILGRMNKGGIVCKGVMMGGNTIGQSAKYVIAKQNETPVNITFEDVYCDVANLAAVAESKAATLSGTTQSFASGEAGYALNQRSETNGTWWTKTESGYDLITDESKQVFKVAFRGAGEEAYYANGGEIFTLPEDEEYELIEGEAEIENGQFTVTGNVVFKKEIKLTDINTSVNGGDFDITSLEEFIYLYEHKAYFQNRNITIHLRCDLDLSAEAAEGFKGFIDPYFSFDGHGYTIKNWGTAANPVASKGLFLAKNGAGGLNYIKNLKLENCHLKDYEDEALNIGMGSMGLIYGAYHGNAGMAGLPAALTLENIFVKDCSLVVGGESTAILLGRYAPESGNHTVTIKNIRIEGTTFDAGEMDHGGLLVGKPRSNNKGGRATFNISDCYLYDNEIVNAAEKNVGFVLGTAEINGVTVNLNNIGIISNKINRSGDAAMIGYSDGGAIHSSNLLIADNEMKSQYTYLVATKNNGLGSVSLTDVYSDETALTRSVESGSHTHTADASKIASGEAAYQINQKIFDPSFWWGMDQGLPIPATDSRTAKITVRDEQNAVKDLFYADGGETFTFAYEKMEYELIIGNGATLSGATLTMPLGGKDVEVRAKVILCEHDYDEENIEQYGDHQHKIPCSKGCGIDLIEDCVYGDWTHGEEGGEPIHSRTCRCSREERAACSYTKVVHIAGSDTHEIQCETCNHVSAVENCTFAITGSNIPAIGERGNASAACTAGCGNNEGLIEILGGDVNQDGEITIADAVVLLRYLNNSIDAKEILVAAGNVYAEDGIAEDFGITTADAIEILKYIMA